MPNVRSICYEINIHIDIRATSYTERFLIHGLKLHGFICKKNFFQVFFVVYCVIVPNTNVYSFPQKFYRLFT